MTYANESETEPLALAIRERDHWQDRAERAEARVAELEDCIVEHLVSSYGVASTLLGYGIESDAIIDVVTCECGARVEGQGRDRRTVRLDHRNGCLLSKIGQIVRKPTELPGEDKP